MVFVGGGNWEWKTAMTCPQKGPQKSMQYMVLCAVAASLNA